MENILTQEEIKVLRKNCRYLASYGMEEGLIEIDVDYDINEDTVTLADLSSYSNNYAVEVLNDVKQILKKVFDYCLSNYLFKEFDVDKNYERIEFLLDCSNGELSVSQYIAYYEEGDSEGVTWEDDEVISDVLSAIELAYTENKTKLPKIVEIAYNGGGDSGYIEGQTVDNVVVPDSVEDFCYRELENNFGGWEINEGSEGSFFFNMKDRLIELSHRPNYEGQQTDTIYELKFGSTQ